MHTFETTTGAASHYDELDPFYREVWGEHVHHGLWLSGRESPTEAARQLVDLVAREAKIDPGDAVCDVGSGYGAPARVFAQEYGASVTALTISKAQHAYTQTKNPPADNPTYLLRDWLKNDLPPASFDAVIAIESVSHISDASRFFSEACRVLRPGGRLVVCAWLAGENLPRWQRGYVLAPICRDGHLAGLRPATTYREWMGRAELDLTRVQDLTPKVRKTWRVCMRRLTGKLLTDRRYRQYLFDRANVHRRFAFVLPRIFLAYWLGAMRYGIFSARKPQ